MASSPTAAAPAETAPAAPIAKPAAAASSNLSQKEVRSRRFRESTTEKIPSTYSSNTAKEDLLLQHVSEFEQQFISVYGNRFLFLCPPNECSLPKFLPTTLHATHMPYRELYEYKQTAEFIADHLNYEQLKPANRYPKVIPSPTSVLSWQAGDSFDFAIALVSLLIGVGYDAYCVSGFAPK